jgi:hypothetical protein
MATEHRTEGAPEGVPEGATGPAAGEEPATAKAGRYPLKPESVGEDTYVVISRGHHDIHAFMAEVRKLWS